jgi:hypothetical protein|tara:strand:+ start:258 stop:536 length:279 start_codon:yes stop_codon:yes gene_type:complete
VDSSTKCPLFTPFTSKSFIIGTYTRKALMTLFDIIQDNVEFMFSDVEEIGTSDVSCCVNSVINEYAPLTLQYASVPTRREIRRAVNEAISVL